MKFSTEEPEELQINLTPLIDVVFLLLIFFMVSTTFSRESQLRIRLPEAATAEQPREKPRALEVFVSANGDYAVKGPDEAKSRPLLNQQAATLQRALRGLMGGNSDDLIVIIRADRKTPHESVVRAMDSSRRLGLTRITFATQTESGSP
ncbi:MAG: biopolymer transporter ExbD [Gammaproteobacteria bacterium]|nr:biopolymer transporter ExbD [Gammaproteobacteria bacterium]